VRKLPLLVFLATAQLCAGAWPGHAGGLINPFDRYGKNINETDAKLLSGSIKSALDQRKAGATASWSDDATGRAGQATVLKVYQREGAECGNVRHAFTKGGGTTYTLPYCLQKDGTWKIQF
jgi:surface antigen